MKKRPEGLMDLPHKPNTCFILGVSRRCGTNFLYRLLNQHRHCIAPGPIWEDFLLSRAHLLAEYVDEIYQNWTNGEWDFESVIGGKHRLEHLLGEAIEEFIRLQLDPQNGEDPFPRKRKRPDEVRYLLTKTPSPQGIDHFHKFFPKAKLIILVRDGRSVVESMVSSFGVSYEDAMNLWRDNAMTIHQFRLRSPVEANQFLIVRYEDLILREHKSVKEIFKFLDLDPGEYDVAAAKSIGITGSSTLRNNDGTVHWKPQVKTAGFDPISRYKNWTPAMHARFNRVAGEQMKCFGYELQPVTSWRILYEIRSRITDLLPYSLRSRGTRGGE